MAIPSPRSLSQKEILRFLQKENAQKIIALLSKSATIKQLQIQLGVDENSVWYHLRRFLDQGLAKRGPKKYKAIYFLTPVGYEYLEKIKPAVWHLL